MEPKIVGRNIAELRKKKSMTQKELADKLNVIDKTISRWECGYGLPDVTILPKIAEVFDVSIEQIIGEEIAIAEDSEKVSETIGDENTTDAESSEKLSAKVEGKTSKNRKTIILAVFVFAVILVALGVVFMSHKNGEDDTIEGHAWDIWKTSDADYVFITVFGYEECMSLELHGDLSAGEFICVETWRESSTGRLLDCKVKGKYKTGTLSENSIIFSVETVIDPEKTEKLKSHTGLGLQYFTAKLESGLYNNASESIYNGKDIEAIVFYSDTKNSETSVFGRWTKFCNYYSRENSEVYFSRVRGNSLTKKQRECLNVEAQKQLGIKAPELLEIVTKPVKTEYYVGERLDVSGLNVSLVYTDGSSENVTSGIIIDEKERVLTPQNNRIEVIYRDEYISVKKSFTVNVDYALSWDIVEKSSSERCYFTHYATGKVQRAYAFGTLELYGDTRGIFIYNETYGQANNVITVIGSYEETDSSFSFKVESIFSSTETQTRFAVGEYISAKIKLSGKTDISFETTYEDRNFFGYYSSVCGDGFSFSRTEGEVYFETVTDGNLSDRAIIALREYGRID